jgi:ferritin-like metal-binding protein YciE
MAQNPSSEVEKPPPIDRDWIASELVKGIDAERALASDTKTRADAPPDPAMGVLYHEIVAADEHHTTVLEKVATRYGHVPSSGMTGSIGQALGHLKEKIVEMGRSAMDQASLDLTAKARSVQWYTAWVHAFETIGDSDSAHDLAGILTEEQSHLDALQQSFNRLVEQMARGSVHADKNKNGVDTGAANNAPRS